MPAVLHQPITGPIFNRILNSIRFKDKPTIKPPYTRNNLIYEVSYIIIKYITLKVIGLSKSRSQLALPLTLQGHEEESSPQSRL